MLAFSLAHMLSRAMGAVLIARGIHTLHIVKSFVAVLVSSIPMTLIPNFAEAHEHIGEAYLGIGARARVPCTWIEGSPCEWPPLELNAHLSIHNRQSFLLPNSP